MIYRYALTQRPPGIGCQPKGFFSSEGFETKQLYMEIDCWGYVHYPCKLNKKILDYYNMKLLEVIDD